MSFSLIDSLERSIQEINRCLCPLILLLGVLGNILNLIMFTRQTFLKQSCSLYFLCISLNNLAMFFFGLTTRILDNGLKLILPYSNSDVYCKIRNYIVSTLFSISSWLFVFATIDHYFATNQVTLRRQFYCSYRTAWKLIISTIIFCIFVHLHVLIFYGYYWQLNTYNQLSLRCTTNSISYDVFYALFILIFYSLLPPFLMTIFSLLTIQNFRKSRRQINSLTMMTLSKTIKDRRETNQLIKTLSIQIFILILFTIPHSIYYIYIGFTANLNSKTNLRREFEQLSFTIVRVLLYINYGSSFYIQIILSKTFRQEFGKFFQNRRIGVFRCF